MQFWSSHRRHKPEPDSGVVQAVGLIAALTYAIIIFCQ